MSYELVEFIDVCDELAEVREREAELLKRRAELGDYLHLQGMKWTELGEAASVEWPTIALGFNKRQKAKRGH